MIRRLASVLYDTLLLLAVLYLSTLPLLALTRGEAVTVGHIGYQLYLLVVAFLFFGGFWTHGGQTLECAPGASES